MTDLLFLGTLVDVQSHFKMATADDRFTKLVNRPRCNLSTAENLKANIKNLTTLQCLMFPVFLRRLT